MFRRLSKKMEQEETGGQNQGALRGTAVHRVMECYQFSAAAGVTEQIEAMLAGGQITEEMKRLVNRLSSRRFSHRRRESG